MKIAKFYITIVTMISPIALLGMQKKLPPVPQKTINQYSQTFYDAAKELVDTLPQDKENIRQHINNSVKISEYNTNTRKKLAEALKALSFDFNKEMLNKEQKIANATIDAENLLSNHTKTYKASDLIQQLKDRSQQKYDEAKNHVSSSRTFTNIMGGLLSAGFIFFKYNQQPTFSNLKTEIYNWRKWLYIAGPGLAIFAASQLFKEFITPPIDMLVEAAKLKNAAQELKTLQEEITGAEMNKQKALNALTALEELKN